MRWFVFVCLMMSFSSFGQTKSFIIGVKGDTLNRIDINNLKQGRWVEHVPELRGEPGYEEEGVYIDGKKNGTWRRYSLMGDLLAIENYRFGYKNGKCTYFSIYGIVREESWKATDPENPYDTVEVPDLNTDAVYLKVVKVDATTVKHGTWTYYDPQTGLITKTEDYVLDKLQQSNKSSAFYGGPNFGDSTRFAAIDTASKVKPKEVLEYEKKNSNKKKIKVRDGATGGP